MSNPKPVRPLFNLFEIAEAGADAVRDWRLSDTQCDRLAALLAPSVGRHFASAAITPQSPGRAA